MNPILFIAWLPVIELLLLIAMAAWLGFWFTLAWIFGTAVLGVVLLKRARQRLAMASGSARGWRMTPPVQAAEIPGVLATWVGAILLILPGPLTDIIGLLLVIPVLRDLAVGAWLTRQAARWMQRRQGAGRVYDGEVVPPRSPAKEQITVISVHRDEPPR